MRRCAVDEYRWCAMDLQATCLRPVGVKDGSHTLTFDTAFKGGNLYPYAFGKFTDTRQGACQL